MKGIVRVAVAAGAFVIATSTVSGQPVPDKNLEAILKDTRIWGKDFAEVLAAMPAFREAGEKQIVVYQRRVQTSREFATRAEAMKVDTQAREASKKTGWRPLPSFRDLLRPVMSRSIVTTKAAAVDTPDREGVHLAWAQTKQLLAAGLTRAVLTEAQGQPQRVTRRIIPTDDERRPVVLTELHYAGGAVIFAQPDYAPRPGVIDRVVLDTTRTTDTVFTK